MGNSSDSFDVNDYKKGSSYMESAGLHVFTGRCRDCNGAFSINVKDLKSGSHRTTIICPHCGVRQVVHVD
ncbi:MAG: hypothetical protein KAS32_11985 [Candidatus Peribacteraceae bacterium]|nr:hypothetical protein [Candidatus Peribacteraceae bacterium]